MNNKVPVGCFTSDQRHFIGLRRRPAPPIRVCAASPRAPPRCRLLHQSLPRMHAASEDTGAASDSEAVAADSEVTPLQPLRKRSHSGAAIAVEYAGTTVSDDTGAASYIKDA